ncbi:DUF3152 domain-containing protein [Plantactinospora sp. B5E13]|uniref:DUF3152 domain-containing protein n=1 Tax=unclassified Plantactinospora TaxID=2631981 RepID=UPI00325C9320
MQGPAAHTDPVRLPELSTPGDRTGDPAGEMWPEDRTDDRADRVRPGDARPDDARTDDPVDAAPPGGRRGRHRLAMARARRRRRRAVALALLSTTAGLVLVGLVHGGPPDGAPVAAGSADGVVAGGPARGAGPSGDAAGAPDGTASGRSDGQPADYPTTGPGTFGYAGGGDVVGTTGDLRRFRVAVEQGMGQDTNGFARAVDTVLGDPRGWTASGKVRFQRVGRTAKAQFTVFLATPGTSERMCAEAGLHTERYGSCHVPGEVVLNIARWLTAVPDYGAPLDVYQAYALNHEVGHELGERHQACPRTGAPAPVMQLQTYGLRGCAPNGWPYVDGRRHVGPVLP